MEEATQTRVNIAWLLIDAHPSARMACDTVLAMDSAIEDPDLRWPKFFTFKRRKGIIDAYNYVQWGGMGLNLQDIGNEDFQQAIFLQTGVKA
jgi:hypothetical protein